jgi:hypothetical protein
MSSPEDSRLRTHFANLRKEDRSATPPFVRTAAASAAFSRGGFSLRIALVTIPVLSIAVMLALRVHRVTEAVPRELAVWSSPTAFLLETPGKQVLNQTPRLGEPLIRDLPAAQDGPK